MSTNKINSYTAVLCWVCDTRNSHAQYFGFYVVPDCSLSSIASPVSSMLTGPVMAKHVTFTQLQVRYNRLWIKTAIRWVGNMTFQINDGTVWSCFIPTAHFMTQFCFCSKQILPDVVTNFVLPALALCSSLELYLSLLFFQSRVFVNYSICKALLSRTLKASSVNIRCVTNASLAHHIDFICTCCRYETLW